MCTADLICFSLAAYPRGWHIVIGFKSRLFLNITVAAAQASPPPVLRCLAAGLAIALHLLTKSSLLSPLLFSLANSNTNIPFFTFLL
jgi:hypothetical protein